LALIYLQEIVIAVFATTHLTRSGSKVMLKLNQRSIISISIALSQLNLQGGEEFLMDVSDLLSPNYGKNW
jgi:hypothetical protein